MAAMLTVVSLLVGWTVRRIRQELAHEQARLERSTGFKIMNGQRRPSRDVLLRVALVLQLDLEEAQQLLKVGRHAPLTPRDSRDQAVIRGLLHKKSLYDVDEMLDQQGEEPL